MMITSIGKTRVEHITGLSQWILGSQPRCILGYGMFGLGPKCTLQFFFGHDHWPLFGRRPSFWHTNASLPTLVQFSSQCWPIHWQAKPQPKFRLNFLA